MNSRWYNYPLSHINWRRLRLLKREGKANGETLRVIMDRQSKHGGHIEELMHHGLIQVKVNKGSWKENVYILTEHGAIAAEYGMFHKEN